ncbi:MAG: hypothetical protein M3081_15980, partial [Gemmatimonadota bacterium]|nr:hypothetical protein [Gemmatimonadota bacterium]
MIVACAIASMVLCAPCSAQLASESARAVEHHYWRNFALGIGGSIVLHEAGHVVVGYAVGTPMTFGLDHGRPTIYSHINLHKDANKQFIFSGMGLTVQTLLDEAILDVPHERGSAVERGILAGGIATAAFYATIGRDASVSDIALMARTSSLSRAEISLIFASVAALHV